jgi:hypothetical protein
MIEYLLENKVIIKIFCEFFTSLGTVLAVWISLYLAYRSNNPKPNINITIGHVPVKARINHPNDLIISIVNKSNYPVIIVSTYPKILFFAYNHKGTLKIENNRLIADKYYSFSNSLKDIIDQTIDAHAYVYHKINREHFIGGLKAILCTSKIPFFNRLILFFSCIRARDFYGNVYKIKYEKKLWNEIKKEIIK